MTEYYIDPDEGSDSNPGTLDQPFASFAPVEWDGKATLQPGDTVYVRGGTMNVSDNVNFYRVEGTESNSIVIQAYQDEQPVIDFSNNSGHGMKFNGSRWFEVYDLEIRNAANHNVVPYSGAQECRNMHFEGLEIYGHSNSGDYGAGFKANEVVDVTLRNCFVHDSAPGAGGNSDGIAFSGGVQNAVVENCVTTRNTDDGIDLWGCDASNPATVRGCVSGRNGYDESGAVVGDGNGFKLGGTSGSGNATVERCVAYDNAARGFNDNTAPGHTLYHCTAWNNGSAGYRMAAGDHALRNCVAHANDGGPGDFSGADDQYNSWNLGIGDPLFTSTDESTGDFLHLSTDSPCIDAGVDVGLSYSGSAPDLGAYEHTSTTYSNAPTLRVYTDSSWQQATVRYYDGAQFVSL